MSVFERRELDFVSPRRARSLLTGRAAISSARFSERPCFFSLSLMCSYWRASFVPFFTPGGGIATSLFRVAFGFPACRERNYERGSVIAIWRRAIGRLAWGLRRRGGS